jgi:hypothetical protein
MFHPLGSLNQLMNSQIFLGHKIKRFSGSKEEVLDETFTEPHNRHSSDPKEKVLDEAFTEPGNKHSPVPKEKVLDETFTDNTTICDKVCQ